MTNYNSNKQIIFDSRKASSMTIKIILYLIFITYFATTSLAKVIELDGRLTNHLKQDPSKGWLVEFYAPWCHHCRKLEPTYADVAETLYHMHDNLIVARVDCTKYPDLAHEFSIESFPTIKYVDSSKRVTFYGDRSVEDIVSFADRMYGSAIKVVDTCQDLKTQIDNHQVILLSNLKDSSEELFLNYSDTAEDLSSNFWFFQTNISSCEGIFKSDDKYRGDIYILKSYKTTPISYKKSINDGYEESLVDFIKINAFPVFSRLGASSLNRGLQTKKLLIIAILEEYEPTKRMTLSNTIFKEVVESLAKDYSENEQNLFGWSSDLSTFESIAIKSIEPIPNLMVLASNLSFYMPTNIPSISNKGRIPEEFEGLRRFLKHFLEEIDKGSIFDKMVGGDGLYYSTKRNIFNFYSSSMKTFKSEPLVISSILCIPVLGICAIIFTICCGFNSTDDDVEHEKED